MERDKQGRFLAGNQVAIGNKGNRRPKFGNKNAVKHGLRRRYTGLLLNRTGGLSIYKGGLYIGELPSKYFQTLETGELLIAFTACQYLILVCGFPDEMFGPPEEW